MYVLSAPHPTSTHGVGFLVMNEHQTTARTTYRCDHASHFYSSTAAALVRERFQNHGGLAWCVVPCLCPVGDLASRYIKQA